jgi:hypothetical protein
VVAAIGIAAALVLGAASAGQVDAEPKDKGGKKNGQAIDTQANYTPGERFEPLASSATCAPALDDPFVLPTDYAQQVVAREGEGGTIDLWDMNTQNEFGEDAGRYVYRTHETTTGSEVSVTDLQEGDTTVLAQRADWERFDGIVWTPWGTILAGEETSQAAVPDPQVPEARAGLVYEFFVDPENPDQLVADDPRDTDGVQDGIIARPALGSKSHEGMRFDKQGYYYGISETNPGSIYRFVPDRKGDLSEGQLQALKTEDGRTGQGVWVDIPDEAARTDAQAAATAAGANGYNRPEDVETGESTGKDTNNGGNTLYVAITGTDEVLAVDLSSKKQPFAYQYVGAEAGNAAPPEFDSPDNLALDSQGNLAITEDPSTVTQGDDVWIAEPSQSGKRQPAAEVGRFSSLKDCAAEPTGIYFALKGTSKFTEGTPREELVTDESLFVNRQHAGQGTTLDQFVSIAPSEGARGEDTGEDTGESGSGTGV